MYWSAENYIPSDDIDAVIEVPIAQQTSASPPDMDMDKPGDVSVTLSDQISVMHLAGPSKSIAPTVTPDDYIRIQKDASTQRINASRLTDTNILHGSIHEEPNFIYLTVRAMTKYTVFGSSCPVEFDDM